MQLTAMAASVVQLGFDVQASIRLQEGAVICRFLLHSALQLGMFTMPTHQPRCESYSWAGYQTARFSSNLERTHTTYSCGVTLSGVRSALNLRL